MYYRPSCCVVGKVYRWDFVSTFCFFGGTSCELCHNPLTPTYSLRWNCQPKSSIFYAALIDFPRQNGGKWNPPLGIPSWAAEAPATKSWVINILIIRHITSSWLVGALQLSNMHIPSSSTCPPTHSTSRHEIFRSHKGFPGHAHGIDM